MLTAVGVILYCFTALAAVAQSVEQWTENPCVKSSILFGGNSGPPSGDPGFSGHRRARLEIQVEASVLSLPSRCQRGLIEGTYTAIVVEYGAAFGAACKTAIVFEDNLLHLVVLQPVHSVCAKFLVYPS